MPYLKVVITAIQIASGAHFANPEGLIYSEQNLADGSVIASQQPLPLCDSIKDPSQSPCVTYSNGATRGYLLLNGCPMADEPVNLRSPITIIQKENGKCWIQYTDESGKQINEKIDEE
jgi:hypothetical protein